MFFCGSIRDRNHNPFFMVDGKIKSFATHEELDMRPFRIKLFTVGVFAFILLLVATTSSHAYIINISTGNIRNGSYAFFDANFTAWQSFTVTQTGNLTTMALILEQDGNTFPAGKVDLYAGEGLGGTSLLTDVNATTILKNGTYYYVADFAGILLNAGMYTVAYHGAGLSPAATVVVADANLYPGGKLYNRGNMGDLVFYTSSPTGVGSFGSGGGAVATPEPGTVMLMGSGLLGMLGFRRRELLAYFRK